MECLLTDYEGLSYEDWSDVEFGDRRLNSRAVQIGSDFLKNPYASPPRMFKSAKKLKAFYRFLDCKKVTHDVLITKHCEKTLDKMEEHDTILAVHDFTTLAYDREYEIKDAYDVGNIQGIVVLNALLIIPAKDYASVDGLLNQFIVKRAPKDKRKDEGLESRYWEQSVSSLTKLGNKKIINVMDRGADSLGIMHHIKQKKQDFVIRARFNRFICSENEEYLFNFARALPSKGETIIEVNKSDPKRKRQAALNVAFSEITLDSPKNRRNIPPINSTIVHVFEKNPPENEEPVEWFLLTSLDVTSLEDALQVIRYYSYRWLIEEYHKCLKTGFRLEKTQLQTSRRIENLLAFISISAVKLLQLREIVKTKPEENAEKFIEREDIEIIKKAFTIKEETISVDKFIRCIAQLGGFLNRKSDGRPGWQTIWEGWKYFTTLKEGINFYKRCG